MRLLLLALRTTVARSTWVMPRGESLSEIGDQLLLPLLLLLLVLLVLLLLVLVVPVVLLVVAAFVLCPAFQDAVACPSCL